MSVCLGGEEGGRGEGVASRECAFPTENKYLQAAVYFDPCKAACFFIRCCSVALSKICALRLFAPFALYFGKINLVLVLF